MAIPTAARDLLTRIMGSRALRRRQVVPYCADKEPGHFVLGREKNNLESNVPFALGYPFTKLAIGYDEKRREDVTASRLVWDGQRSIRSNHRPRQGGWGTSQGRDAGGHVASRQSPRKGAFLSHSCRMRSWSPSSPIDVSISTTSGCTELF
jgi:hypothetical protein